MLERLLIYTASSIPAVLNMAIAGSTLAKVYGYKALPPEWQELRNEINITALRFFEILGARYFLQANNKIFFGPRVIQSSFLLITTEIILVTTLFITRVTLLAVLNWFGVDMSRNEGRQLLLVLNQAVLVFCAPRHNLIVGLAGLVNDLSCLVETCCILMERRARASKYLTSLVDEDKTENAACSICRCGPQDEPSKKFFFAHGHMHSHHKDCLMTWFMTLLEAGQAPTCPLCTQALITHNT